jgi:hypothetical protein
MSASVLGQTLPSGIPTTNLKAYYSFNNSLNDLSGNNHTASYLGNSSRVDGYNPCLDSANNFQGYNEPASNSIEFPTTLMSAMNNLSAGSVSLCFNLDSLANHSHYFGIDNTLLAKQKHGSNSQLNLSIQDGKVRFHLTGGFPSATNFVSTTTVSINVWYNVTCTWDGQTIKMYINGVLDNSMSSSATLSNMSSPSYFAIGALNGIGGSGSYSSIDNVAFWSSSLSSSEVSQLYQSQLNCCTDSLEFHPQNFTAYSGTGWANFKCKSTDTAATYQWQQSSGAGWIDLTNLGNYSGATSDSIVITGVTSAMNNYGYRCIVTSCATDTSNVAVLTVENGIGLGESMLQKLTISPNPTIGLVSLNTSVIGTYELLTLDGRVHESGTAKQEYDLTTYPKGVYHLRLSTDEGTRVLKVVKN